jgi:hypothetical protein
MSLAYDNSLGGMRERTVGFDVAAAKKRIKMAGHRGSSNPVSPFKKNCICRNNQPSKNTEIYD